MRWPLTAIVVLIAVAAIALPTLAVTRYDRQSSPPTMRLKRLQAIAEASCKCARRATGPSGKAECWRTFDVAAAPDIVPEEGGASACLPLSSNEVCLRTGECFVKSYNIIVGGGQDAFCTKAEAMVAEDAFAAQPGIETPQGTRISFDVLFDLSRAYARGDRAATVQSHGCAGGQP
jgi:hypothetical protein